MEFRIRRAAEADLPGIMEIMEEAGADPAHPDWFVKDDLEFVERHLEGQGFVMIAETEKGETAGFFLVKEPDEEENLGRYLDFTPEMLCRTAIMDSAAVKSRYRGFGLQGRMLEEAEKRTDPRFAYLMCTIHPDNRYSLCNMQKHGYEVKKLVKCYGGLDRYILLKERERGGQGQLSPEK